MRAEKKEGQETSQTTNIGPNLRGLLQGHGLSDDAINAFKEGKGIYSQHEETPFGTNVQSDWEGKEEE